MNKQEDKFNIPHFLSNQNDNDNDDINIHLDIDFINEKNTESIHERDHGYLNKSDSNVNYNRQKKLKKCYFNLKCTKFPNCKFLHDFNNKIISDSNEVINDSNEETINDEIFYKKRCNNGTRCPERESGCNFKHEPWPECIFGIDCKYNGDGCKKKHSKKILFEKITKDN